MITGIHMEPMLPDGSNIALEEQALEFTRAANRLSGSLPEMVQEGVGELVRSMNCYYSNLIEGHRTLPREIDNALQDRYSDDPPRRQLQEEAVAHIAVQKMIDNGEGPNEEPTSAAYIRWIHREFCRRLPEELLKVKYANSDRTTVVVPGEYRIEEVSIGKHQPPPAPDLEALMAYFQTAYSADRSRGIASVYAIPAAHHRFLWIHPFADGNGRVARLLSHAMLLRAGFGSPLWSVSRGLARTVERYREQLAAADLSRQGDLDGRGSLSQRSLVSFCDYFFGICIDQVQFMESLLQPAELGRRIELYTRDEIDAGRLPKGSTAVLIEALIKGQVERGKLPELTGYKERQARMVLAKLIERGLLVSTGPRKPVRLGFPLHAVERWLPALYV